MENAYHLEWQENVRETTTCAAVSACLSRHSNNFLLLKTYKIRENDSPYPHNPITPSLSLSLSLDFVSLSDYSPANEYVLNSIC